MTTVIRRVRLSFGRLAQLTAPVLLAVGLFALGTGGASAVPTSCPGTAGTTDREFTLTPNLGTATCFDYDLIGKNPEATNPEPAWISSYVLIDKTDKTGAESGALDGALTLTPSTGTTSGLYSILAPGYTSFILLIKSGFGQITPVWAAFTLSADALSGGWAISGQQAISHGSLYGLVAPVPVPAGIALGAAGLGILGFLGWRRKKTVA